MSIPISCDIFCTVVDNYGDIGVCWRLARQLSQDHGIAVRLWLDDLATLQRLCPEVNTKLAQQKCREVEICHWVADFPSVEPAQLVIEAFACELPERYVFAMAEMGQKPVWLNLEYFSAEDWVEDCHRMPSPHPQLPLVKYFFFPGVTHKTGGLLLERDLIARRDAFQNSQHAIDDYWKYWGLEAPRETDLRVSLFSYENSALPGLLQAWVQGNILVTCLVPEGRSLPQVAAFFNASEGRAGDAWQLGNLSIKVLPFVEQERYDSLLWACDINFVRGEDSFARAQWAARPFVWHIYPQHDGIHMHKLEAFIARYSAGLTPEVTQAMQKLWVAWNEGVDPASAWNDFLACRSMLAERACAWAQQLSGNDLALNLLDFFREVGRMRDF